MKYAGLYGLATTLGIAAVHAADIPSDPEAYTRSVAQWRRERVAQLTQPDGWLSLVGLAWLQPGANSLGTAADNTVILPGGPAHLGVIHLTAAGAVQLTAQAGGVALIDGKPMHVATLVDDAQAGAGKPTLVSLGTLSFHVIDREGRKGLRIKDAQAASRTGFLGIDYFPIDPAWRVQADWVPADPDQTLEMATVIGTTEEYAVPGKLRFTRDGKDFEILPVLEVPGDKQYFVVFADRTSGKETYGAARFVYIDRPQAGKAILDFNRAYNPPCAFTAFATCPLAPPENRLDLRVTAGEKNYRGSQH